MIYRDISGSMNLYPVGDFEGLIVRPKMQPSSFADIIKLKPLAPEGDVVQIIITDGEK